MPNVAIILCRFHCVNIFNENTTAEESKEKLRKYLKGMLFCETQNEYNAYYVKVCQVASEGFKTYFDNNWHSSAVCYWKGYERLDFITKGVTTTNHNESWHGKLKKLLNRKRTIADMFSKLRVFHENSINTSLYLEFTNVAKVHYVLNNSDPTVAEITRTSTPYVSSQIRKQYELSLKIDALPANYALDSKKCVCTFFKSYSFPCVHIFFSRRMQDVPLFSIDDIDSKWRVVGAQLSENSVANANEELMDDLEADNLEPPPPVFKPPNPLKVGGRKLNSRERYTDFLKVCERAGGVASVTGGQQFSERRKIIEDIVSMWENNQEVVVMPLARGAVSVHHSVTAEQSTVTASDAVSAESGVSPTRPSVIVPHPEIDITAKPTVNCRCNLEALRYVAKYGANRGRVCYRCPKTLPQVPCLFQMVESSNHQDISKYSSDTRKGITVHNVGVNSEERPSLSLPPKIVVKGQPKSSHQRTFKKKQKKDTVKAWSDCEEKRKTSADTIKDADVKQLSATLWEVKSQNGTNVYIVRQVKDIGSTCLCEALCSHCFECDCMDFTIRRYPCKHIHKVFAVNNELLPGNEDSHLNDDYDEGSCNDVKPLKAQLPVEDGLIITLSDSENDLEDTPFMEEGSYNDVKPLLAKLPIEEGLIIDLSDSESETEEAATQSEQPILLCHICNKTSAEQIKCIVCKELMHGTLPCSLDNMCNHCCGTHLTSFDLHFFLVKRYSTLKYFIVSDYSFEEYYGCFRVAGQKKKGPPYFCFGCNLLMRLHIAKNPKSPSRKGDFYYSCNRNKTKKCDSMFWASKGLKDISSPQSTGNSLSTLSKFAIIIRSHQLWLQVHHIFHINLLSVFSYQARYQSVEKNKYGLLAT
ncbi:uncharacterized protein LOC113214593 isoform X1 [Frankliniella occidentalis]|uniref:Uncharacterized protein LOC113214593 isoform X1 n=1 Tax=Frankliniella occidentalis TaxID=133901 RepID=A0A9C6XT29_FRAOC|nr:uncharacterized protein LOC113214593 isoform X1 [Frankliniella occidentalis]